MGIVCSLKQDAEGKLDFSIDDVSHISRLRRKTDVHIIKQNKGISL